MKRAALCFILGLSLLWVGIAAAAPPQLKGRYAFTGEASCLVAKHGFNDDLTPIDGNVNSHSFSVQGVRTFNGDGTGTVEATAVEIVPPPFNPDASSQTFSYQFTTAGTYTYHCSIHSTMHGTIIVQ